MEPDSYFDDDDLINDYVEDYFEPPLNEDMDEDGFLEEEEEANAVTCNKAVSCTDTMNALDVPILTKATAAIPRYDFELEFIDPNKESPLKHDEILAEPVIRAGLPPRRHEELCFNFDRYNGGQTWRTNDDLSRDNLEGMPTRNNNNFQKLHRRTTPPSLSWSDSKRLKTSAPGAKLVELLEEKSFRWRKHSISSRSDAIRETPKEGEESMPMTLGNGTRIYVRINKAPVEAGKSDKSSSKYNILGVSMEELTRRSNAIQRNKEQTFVTAALNDSAEYHHQNSPGDHSLWVDKHAPTSFAHLLSDERINREVLWALRAWDPYVFRRPTPRRPNFTSGDNQSNKDEPPKAATLNLLNDIRPGEQNRVILLSGPPGVGKTTLAHIIARHAGYRPLEVNASDERSSAVLKDRVLQSMESSTLNLVADQTKKTLFGRPNCLIMDEIDGADAKGAIATLVEIIRAEIPTKGSKTKSKKSFLRRPMIFICNHKYAPVLRPLLPFAKHFDVNPPSLPRLVARLKAILCAENLTVGGGALMLNNLVSSSGGDIRSCLYTLQFAAAQARQVPSKGVLNDSALVDIAPVLNSTSLVGAKDERSDLASTITAVFRKVKEKKNEWSYINTKTITTAKESSVDKVIDIVQQFGDPTKSLDCLLMNVMRVSYIDPTLDRCAAAHEWMSSADLLCSNPSSNGSNNNNSCAEHFVMQRLQIPTAAAAIHLLCRIETRSDLTFSTRELADNYFQREVNLGLIQRFAEGCAVKVRANMSTSFVASETIPYALWTLSAGDGSNSLHRAASTVERLTPNEQQSFRAHIANLLSFGLKYVPADDGPVTERSFGKPLVADLRLEPPIDNLARFIDLKLTPGQERKRIPTSLKALLAQTASQEGLRERAASIVQVNDNGNTVAQQAVLEQADKMHNKEQGIKINQTDPENDTRSGFKRSLRSSDGKINPAEVSTISQQPMSKRARASEMAAKNFLGVGAAKAKAAKSARRAALVGFHRSVIVKSIQVSNSGSGVPLQQVIRFKYQKGFTQAVRAPCRLEDLII